MIIIPVVTIILVVMVLIITVKYDPGLRTRSLHLTCTHVDMQMGVYDIRGTLPQVDPTIWGSELGVPYVRKPPNNSYTSHTTLGVLPQTFAYVSLVAI